MSAQVETPVLDVAVYCDLPTSTWVMTPLSNTATIEVRAPTEVGVLPAEAGHGVIWRLDDQVFGRAREGFDGALRHSILSVPPVQKRLKRVASGVDRLKVVTAKLEAKIARFQADKVEVENRSRRLDEREAAIEQQLAGIRQRDQERQADVDRIRLEMQRQRDMLEQEKSRLALDRQESEEKIRKTLAELEVKLQSPQKAGDVGVYSSEAFFLAMQDELARAVPVLNRSDQERLEQVAQHPEEAFSEARDRFMKVPGNEVDEKAMRKRVDAIIIALLSLQHIRPEQEPPASDVHKLEFLFSSSRALARYSNCSGRWPLAFASSTVAVWCASPLSSNLGKTWEELESSRLADEAASRSAPSKGAQMRRVQLLEQFNSMSKRLLRCWAEHGDHRRRFIRFAANSVLNNEQLVVDADIRLLLGTHSATSTELAAHIRRVSNLIDDNKEVSARMRRRTLSKSVRAPEVQQAASKPMELCQSHNEGATADIVMGDS